MNYEGIKNKLTEEEKNKLLAFFISHGHFEYESTFSSISTFWVFDEKCLVYYKDTKLTNALIYDPIKELLLKA